MNLATANLWKDQDITYVNGKEQSKKSSKNDK